MDVTCVKVGRGSKVDSDRRLSGRGAQHGDPGQPVPLSQSNVRYSNSRRRVPRSKRFTGPIFQRLFLPFSRIGAASFPLAARFLTQICRRLLQITLNNAQRSHEEEACSIYIFNENGKQMWTKRIEILQDFRFSGRKINKNKPCGPKVRKSLSRCSFSAFCVSFHLLC